MVFIPKKPEYGGETWCAPCTIRELDVFNWTPPTVDGAEDRYVRYERIEIVHVVDFVNDRPEDGHWMGGVDSDTHERDRQRQWAA